MNPYGRQLTDKEILVGVHREFIGGMWETIGKLQLDFMVGQGMEPGHKLLDVGCGALRGGVCFIHYLERANYHGIDLNASLVKAGETEIRNAGLEGKGASLLVNDAFEVGRFGESFDFAIAVSLFTHLPMNHIVRCLSEVRKVLAPGGCFFASFFEAPGPGYLSALLHDPGGITTHYDRDPYHYAFEEMRMLGSIAQLDASLVGEWNHPRNQRMVKFARRPA